LQILASLASISPHISEGAGKPALAPLTTIIMSDDTQAAAAKAENTPVEVSDEELLKQKKEESKAAKAEEKAEKKAAKEERVHSAHHGKAKDATVQTRNPLKMHGKKHRAAAEKIEKLKLYPLAEAVKLVQETSTTKFDSSVEIHVRLGIDPKKTDQQIRSTVALPAGTGKTLKVVAFVAAEQAADAKKAGAIEAGEEELIEKIGKGWLDFDVAVATPDMMKKIGKIAKTLGQKGLMPNPKAGTVTEDIAGAIAEIQKGKVEFRNDKAGILHNLIGKVSFDAAKLEENIRVYLTAVNEMKPKAVKGTYLASVSLASSMGPGIKVDARDL